MTILGIPAGELAVLVGAILIAGTLTGIFAGLLGIGGAAISVPVMYEVFKALGVADEVRMQLCVGTALALIVPTSIRSYFAHRAKGMVDDEVLKIWALPIIAGVVIGSFIAYFASATVFKLIFVVFATLMALKLFFGRESWRIADLLPGKGVTAAVGLAIGVVSALMGIGGGAYAVLFLTLYGVSIHRAVSTSAGVGVLISIPGVIGYMIAGWPQQALMPPLSIGYVSLLAVAVFAPMSVLAAPYGARMAHAWPRRRLEVAFGVFLMVVAIRFFASLMGWF
ncbi:MAG: sulfite exporter TauE/SafE family protein [Xanthobacteraceae bacterium]|nr:sulfite exporter TauE/SafE family protein [Xanthobacteraceae bacterium]QYK45833.1 MAG: sulfite exporter TauE/SafE family protein [Xanthobacteraceae bacterium]